MRLVRLDFVSFVFSRDNTIGLFSLPHTSPSAPHRHAACQTALRSNSFFHELHQYSPTWKKWFAATIGAKHGFAIRCSTIIARGKLPTAGRVGFTPPKSLDFMPTATARQAPPRHYAVYDWLPTHCTAYCSRWAALSRSSFSLIWAR